MSLIKKLLAISLLLVQLSIFSETKVLKAKDIRPIVEQMTLYHVENQSINATIVRRSLKLFFEQFDPEKVYFLHSEVSGYIELSESQAEKILKKIQNDDYKDFYNANKQIQSAINRSRAIRLKVLDDLKKDEYVLKSPINKEERAGYVGTKSELYSVIENHVRGWLESEKKNTQFNSFTLEEKEKALFLYEKRVERYENPYLGVDSKGVELSKVQQEHAQVSQIIKCFAKSLDAHTAFFSPEEAISLRTSLQKQFKGIGVVLREGGQGVFIADLVKGGPAFASELIQKGDLVLAIDGIKTKDKSFEEILELMQGLEGSYIRLTLQRKGGAVDQTFDISLKRQKITMDDDRLSYSYERFADGIIGKIEFNAFYDNGEGVTTEKDFKEALKNLRNEGKLLGLVIDVRQNPGGFLSQAVKVSGLFIPRGIVAIAKYSTGEIQYSRDLDGRLYFNGPIVIVTSKASASAAEVVAQALQDYGVAIVVGDERTFGKGSMQFQNITDDKASAYFKVTVGRYYTISGRSTQIEGVKADIVVPSYYAPYPIGERYLQYPITRDDLGFSFIDPHNPLRKLSGIDTDHLFSSYFPKQQMKWKNMLVKLKANSAERIHYHLRYQEFIGQLEDSQAGKKVQFSPWKEDIQLQESVNIVKDMILMDRLGN